MYLGHGQWESCCFSQACSCCWCWAAVYYAGQRGGSLPSLCLWCTALFPFPPFLSTFKPKCRMENTSRKAGTQLLCPLDACWITDENLSLRCILNSLLSSGSGSVRNTPYISSSLLFWLLTQWLFYFLFKSCVVLNPSSWRKFRRRKPSSGSWKIWNWVFEDSQKASWSPEISANTSSVKSFGVSTISMCPHLLFLCHFNPLSKAPRTYEVIP